MLELDTSRVTRRSCGGRRRFDRHHRGWHYALFARARRSSIEAIARDSAAGIA